MTWNNKNKGVTNRWWIKHQIYFHSLRGWRSERMKGAVCPNKIKFRMPSGLCWEEGHISCLLMQESLFSPAFMMYSNPQALIEQTIIKTHLIFCTSTLSVDLNTSLWWFVTSRIINQKLFTARTWFRRKQKSRSTTQSTLVNSQKKKPKKKKTLESCFLLSTMFTLTVLLDPIQDLKKATILCKCGPVHI